METERLNYLYEAIADTQSIINFIDTKTAGGVTIIGLFLASLFSMLDDLLKYNHWFSSFHWIFLGLTVFSLLLCIVVVARILKPTVNPECNVRKEATPKLKFFLAQNNYDHGRIGKLIYPYYNSKQFKLVESLDSYISALADADKNELGKSLSYELLKLSFIRNIKNDRFHFLFKLLVVTSLFFISFFICHAEEMIVIKSLIACGRIS